MSFLEGIAGSLVSFIFGMVVVAFFILSERKILAYMQVRKGPNKVGLTGFLQSFADFIKLVCKFKVIQFNNRSWLAFIGVSMVLLVVCLYCSFLSACYFSSKSNLSLLYVLLMSSFSGYGLLSAGWGSFSKYSFLSSVRCCFSSVSFEAFLMCLIIMVSIPMSGYSSSSLNFLNLNYMLLLPLLFIFWLVGLLGESGRPPFDYQEAESETVSGMSVEYCGVTFTSLFACEYFMMFFFSWLTSMAFLGGSLVVPSTLLMLFFFIWSRATFPRSRYDYYVKIMWKWCLFMSLISLYTVV